LCTAFSFQLPRSSSAWSMLFQLPVACVFFSSQQHMQFQLPSARCFRSKRGTAWIQSPVISLHSILQGRRISLLKIADIDSQVGVVARSALVCDDLRSVVLVRRGGDP